MPIWKVLFIMLFGCVCLGLVIATLIVPTALTPADHKWLWFSGLLVASLFMCALFALFLRSADDSLRRSWARRDR
jgi:hypothetical protein